VSEVEFLILKSGDRLATQLLRLIFWIFLDQLICRCWLILCISLLFFCVGFLFILPMYRVAPLFSALLINLFMYKKKKKKKNCSTHFLTQCHFSSVCCMLSVFLVFYLHSEICLFRYMIISRHHRAPSILYTLVLYLLTGLFRITLLLC
jgi:hypothetical protein